MKVNLLKKLALMMALPLLGTIAFSSASPAKAGSKSEDFDAAAYFKAKCVMCHGATAQKKFDSTMSDEDLVELVLKGKKAEKPPNMPAYAEKGVTADQAKALVTLMKQLHPAPAK